MIRGLILDVDGVLVGNKEGYNWPLPHNDVLEFLRNLHARGLNISLCTGKGTFAIKEIVEKAHLDNLHIGDGGAVVIDYIGNKTIDTHFIEPGLVQDVIETYQARNTYVELYTVDGYYVQQNHIGDITKKHAAILYKDPKVVTSLLEVTPKLEIVKIMPVAKDENDKREVIKSFDKFADKLTLQWGVHPTALPLQFGIVTMKGISKCQAAHVISQSSGIPLEEMLGIGDGMTDWDFMRLCGYAGAMGNASDALKEKISGRENGYVGKSVNENGVLDILTHFKLT